MIENLYVNGCSWCAGNELDQDPAFDLLLEQRNWHKQDAQDDLNWNIVDSQGNIVSRYEDHYDEFTWAGRLKNRAAAKFFLNDAQGGGSNQRILRTTLDYVKSLKTQGYSNTLIVIGWTTSGREEIYVDGTWQRWNTNQKFSTTVDRVEITNEDYIRRLDQFQEDYIGLVYNDQAQIVEYFNSVYLLDNLLSHLGIRHFFFNALPAWWEGGEYKTDCDVEKVFEKDLAWHENTANILHYRDSFMHYVNRNNLTVGKYLHPLAQAHESWANYIWQEMVDRKIIDE